MVTYVEENPKKDTLYGLTRILLHNSYFNGLTVCFNTDGHSNASGGNGAGKTSALNLIPILYGAEPNQLVSQVSGKLPFIDYYLPTQASALVFEHRREDGHRLALMYRHTTGVRTIYRFVHGSLEDTFLRDDIRPLLNAGRPITEILGVLQAQGIEVSRQIDNITDYRAIIQNDKRLLRRGGSNRNRDMALARQYCLGGPDSHMSHLDRMSYSVLKRDDMFNRLQQMIADTQFGDIHIEDKPAYLRDKSLVDDISSLRSFSAAEGDIRQCVELHQSRTLLLKDLDQVAGQLKAAVGAGEQRRVHLGGRIKALEADLTELSQCFEVEHRELLNELNRLQSEVDQLDTTITIIHEEHADWLGQDITQKKADFKNLEQLTQRESELSRALDQLTTKVENLEIERAKASTEADQAYEQHRSKLAARELALTQQQVELDRLRHENAQQLTRERDQALDAFESSDIHSALEPLNQKVGDLTAQARTASRTLNEEQMLTRLEQEHQLAVDQQTLARKKWQDAEEQTRQHQKRIDQALEALQAAKQAVATAEDNCTNLTNLLHPVDGTLLAELRQHHPDWAHSIGRVINPDLLARKDLEPHFLPQQKTFYGWSLALSKLDPVPASASEAVLKERLEHAESLLRNAKEIEENQRQGCEQLTAKMKPFQEAQFAAKHELNRLQREAETLQTRYSSYRAESQAAAEQRQVDAKQTLKEVEAEIRALRESIRERKQAIRERFDEQAREADALYQSNRQIIEDDINRVKEQLAQAIRDHDADLALIDQRFSEQCLREGVDPGQIQAARQALKVQSVRIETVKGYETDLLRYDRWLKERWQTLEAKQSRFHQLSLARDEARERVLARERRFKQEEQQLRETLHTQQSALDTLSQALSRAQLVLQRVGAVEDGVHEDDLPDLDPLADALEGMLEDERRLRQQLLRKVERIGDILRQYGDSKIHNAWAYLLEQRKARTGLEEFDVEFKLQLPDDLAYLVDEQLPDLRNSLFEQIRAVGDSLSRYHGSLKVLNDEVIKVSRHLREKINTNQRIDSLTDIELHVTSKVVEGDYWERLTAFNKQWIEWRERRDSGLPSDTLMAALTDANDALQRADIRQDLKSLIGLRITVVENGRMAVVNNSREFDELSSNGLSYLALIVIYIGMARYLCPNPNIALHWPVDELANLSPENIARVFEMFDEAGLYFFSAFPSTDPNLLKFFKHRTLIDRQTGIRAVAFEELGQDDPARQRMKQAMMEMKD